MQYENIDIIILAINSTHHAAAEVNHSTDLDYSFEILHQLLRAPIKQNAKCKHNPEDLKRQYARNSILQPL